MAQVSPYDMLKAACARLNLTLALTYDLLRSQQTEETVRQAVYQAQCTIRTGQAGFLVATSLGMDSDAAQAYCVQSALRRVQVRFRGDLFVLLWHRRNFVTRFCAFRVERFIIAFAKAICSFRVVTSA